MIQHATNETHGPLRAVVGTAERVVEWGKERRVVIDEVLECGHRGALLRPAFPPGSPERSPGKRRRCSLCLGAE